MWYCGGGEGYDFIPAPRFRGDMLRRDKHCKFDIDVGDRLAGMKERVKRWLIPIV